MTIKSNVSLKSFNTFGIAARAKTFVSVKNLEELKSILASNKKQDLFILGGGSNMLLTKDIEALVLHINLKGISVIDETDHWVTVKVLSGENWHDFVLWCLNKDYGGVENLSLIPGNVGAAPIQNIGAYGVELRDVFVSCEAIHIETQLEKTFTKADCKFGYRDSVFKQEFKGKYIITSVSLKLSKYNHKLHTKYGAISAQIESMGIKKPTLRDISEAVIHIRQSKLPDPKEIGNSGSFFKNPIISISDFYELQSAFPNVPHYVVSDTKIKVPAGWLIETAGFKGKRFGDHGVHNKQALVLVNYGNASGKAIYQLAQLIQKTIYRLFNIHIETEVNII